MAQMDIAIAAIAGAGQTVVIELDGDGGAFVASLGLSPAQARSFAADLNRLADEVEARPHRPSSVSVTQHVENVAPGSTVIGYRG